MVFYPLSHLQNQFNTDSKFHCECLILRKLIKILRYYYHLTEEKYYKGNQKLKLHKN